MIRLAVLIAILIFTFWVGVKIGMFRGEYGWNYYYGGGQGCGMMSDWNNRSYKNRQTTPGWQMYYNDGQGMPNQYMRAIMQ